MEDEKYKSARERKRMVQAARIVEILLNKKKVMKSELLRVLGKKNTVKSTIKSLTDEMIGFVRVGIEEKNDIHGGVDRGQKIKNLGGGGFIYRWFRLMRSLGMILQIQKYSVQFGCGDVGEKLFYFKKNFSLGCILQRRE